MTLSVPGFFLKAAGERLRGDVALAGDVGDQAAMVALIELRPVGIAQGIEHGKSLVGLAGRFLHPGAGEGRGEIGDRTLAGLGEMLIGLVVFALLEGLAAEQELRDAVRGSILTRS